MSVRMLFGAVDNVKSNPSSVSTISNRQNSPLADDDFSNALLRLKNSIMNPSPAADMRDHPQQLEQLRKELFEIEKATQNPRRYFLYADQNGRCEGMIEARKLQHEIDQLFSYLDHLENT